MSIEEMKKEIEALKEDSDQIEFKKIPNGCDVEVSDVVSAKDKNQKKCLYVTYTVLNGIFKGKYFVSKYTAYHYDELIEALKELKLNGFEKGQKLHLELKVFPMGFPRHIPTAII